MPDPDRIRLRHDLGDALLVLAEEDVRYLLGVIGAIQYAATTQLRRGGPSQAETIDGQHRDVRPANPLTRVDETGRKRVAVNTKRPISQSKPPPHNPRALRLYKDALEYARAWADELLDELDGIVGEPPA